MRVLYVDIDVHHGDGVEEAFYATNRVMTVSFHEFGPNFFPGTGAITSVGVGEGKYYAVNVPFLPFMDDAAYHDLFRTVMDQVIPSYNPNVIVLQAGADCLAHDRIGHQNLTIRGHAECVKFLATKNIPLVVLGGGGYTITNVAKCWTYGTGTLLNIDIDGKIPEDDEYSYMYNASQSISNTFHF